MPQPSDNLNEEEELEMLRLQKARAMAQAPQYTEAEKARIRARARADGLPEPTFDRPAKTQANTRGAIHGFTDSVDALVDSFENYNPQPDAGIRSPADAFLFKANNALLGGAMQRAGNDVIPGERLGDRAVIASNSYPVGATAGQMAGMSAQILPAQRAVGVLKSVPGVKQIVDTVGKTRAGAYTGRLASGMAGWTAESALQGATTLADEYAAYTGQGASPEDRAKMAKQVATMTFEDLGLDTPYAKNVPLTVAGPLAGSLLRRAGTGYVTGGRTITPKHVRQSVAEGQNRLSVGTDVIPQVLDTVAVSKLRPQALDGVARVLERAGLTSDDVRTLATQISKRIESATGAASRKTVAQHLIDIVDGYRPQVTERVIQQLRELRMVARAGQNSPGIVRAVTGDLTRSQVPFLGRSADSSIGTGERRLATAQQIADEKRAIGSQYDGVLAKGARNNAEVLGVVQGPNMSALMKPLREMAAAEGLDLAALVNRNPAAAAHWMAWKAGTISRSASEKVTRNNYATLRKRLLRTLDNNVDGYSSLRGQYADQYEFESAVTFGDKLFGSGASKTMNNPGLQDELLEDFFSLSPRAQEIARNSIRDAALAPLRGGPEEAAARLTALKSNSALNFFERIGANEFADNVRTIRDEQMFIRAIDPDANSRSLPNAIAIEDAPKMRNSTLANLATGNQNAGSDMLIGAGASTIPGIGPWAWLWPARRVAAGAGRTAFQTRTETLDDMARFFLMRGSDSALSPVNRIGRSSGGSGLAAHLATQPDQPQGGPANAFAATEARPQAAPAPQNAFAAGAKPASGNNFSGGVGFDAPQTDAQRVAQLRASGDNELADAYAEVMRTQAEATRLTRAWGQGGRAPDRRPMQDAVAANNQALSRYFELLDARQNKPVQNGIPNPISDRQDLGMTAAGAVGGGTIGMDDYNNDGKVDWKDWNTPEGRGAVLSGAAAGLMGSKLGKMGPPRLPPDVKTNGIGGPGLQRRRLQEDIRTGLQDMGATSRIQPDDRAVIATRFRNAGAETAAAVPDGAARNSYALPEQSRSGLTQGVQGITPAQAKEELGFALRDLENAGAVEKGWANRVLGTIGDQAPELLDDAQVARIIQREGIARMVREQEPWNSLPSTLSDRPLGVSAMEYLDDFIPEVEFTKNTHVITKTGLLILGTGAGTYIAYRLNGGQDPLLESYQRKNPPPPALRDQPSAPIPKPPLNAFAATGDSDWEYVPGYGLRERKPEKQNAFAQ